MGGLLGAASQEAVKSTEPRLFPSCTMVLRQAIIRADHPPGLGLLSRLSGSVAQSRLVLFTQRHSAVFLPVVKRGRCGKTRHISQGHI